MDLILLFQSRCFKIWYSDYNTLYCFLIQKQKINGFLNCYVSNDIVCMFYLQYNCNTISFNRFDDFMILNHNDIIIYGW